MPIIEIAHPDAPLSQGDVLSGLVLYETDSAKDTHAKSPAKFCLVLSRPCVAAHKQVITVAAIAKYAPNVPKDIETFEDRLAFLTEMRDGTESPDVFYLGQIPSLEGRYCARLDQVHSIKLPPSDPDSPFLAKHRIASLNSEFQRDLHLRVFRAFASLGFDDYKWFSDADLSLLVRFGEADLDRLKNNVGMQVKKEARQDLLSAPFGRKDLNEAEVKLAALQQAMEPYRLELARRQQTPPGQ